MRLWMAAAMRLGVASQVKSVTLSIHSPANLVGVHSAANANGAPPSSWK